MGLAIPTMASEVPSNLIPSALWNANVYNLGTFTLGPPDFVGYQNTTQSIPNNSWTSLSLDTTVVDTYGGHSNVTNNSRYTCQTGVPGYYTLCGCYAPVGNNSGFRGVRVAINGSPVLFGAAYSGALTTAELGIVTPARDFPLNAGDYVEVQAYQQCGSALNTVLDVDLRSGLWVKFSHV